MSRIACKLFKQRRMVCSRLFTSTKYVVRCQSTVEDNLTAEQKRFCGQFPLSRIRNFSIIAHIDHGKSTFADRILEVTGAISRDDANKQVLDKLLVEKERGITVKAQSSSIIYNYNNEDYLLNFIDTPGHVDFSYEVSRSLAACQGVILLIDANQGVQAQTVANFYMAFTQDLVIIPVLNKIDLKHAKPDLVCEQLFSVFDIDPDDVFRISAKLGIGITDVLDAIVERIPSPELVCQIDAPLRAFLYDSWFDVYKGVVCLVQVRDGVVQKGDVIASFYTKKSYEVKTMALLTPNELPVNALYTGQIGIFTANIRQVSEARVGDTFHHKGHEIDPLPGFRPAKPMVFAGVYPMDQSEQPLLTAAVERLTLNDSSVSVERETSQALGLGYRLGFLGLLHMEVFNQRLEQEYGAHAILTTPSVPYKVKLKPSKLQKQYGTDVIYVRNPQFWPEMQFIEEAYEPMVKGTIIVPEEHMTSVMRLCQDIRGEQLDLQNLDSNRMILTFKLPLAEILVNFFDSLKSLTSGYASFDYEDYGYTLSSLVKLDFKLNGNQVEELSTIVHSSVADKVARQMCLKLCDTIPRQMFQIAVQAAVGSKIIARETIKALRKDVVAKCYGGDITRKMKLLKRQAEGKKRMKMVGNIEIPRDTFISVLKK